MVTMYDVKTKLLTLISESHLSLSPQATHVLGNWKVNVWKLPYSNFPIITVRIVNTFTEYQYGFKTPTLDHGQYFNYMFTAFVYGRTLDEARELGDAIITYLGQNHKQRDTNIIDITNLMMRETVVVHGTQRMFIIVVSGIISTEESI